MIYVVNAILFGVLSYFWHLHSGIQIWMKTRCIQPYFVIFTSLAFLSLFPRTLFSPSLCPPCTSLPLFLHAISPESCSSGCTPRPTKPINTVYVIDPSACLVYTVCARLCPKETLTFHMQGSPPSLSHIIVQLKSQLEPIMWEGLAEDSWRKKTLFEWEWWGGKGMFPSHIHFSIASLPLAESFCTYLRSRLWETEAAMYSHCLMNQLPRRSCDPPHPPLYSGVQRLSLKLVLNLCFNIIEKRCKLALYWQ